MKTHNSFIFRKINKYTQDTETEWENKECVGIITLNIEQKLGHFQFT